MVREKYKNKALRPSGAVAGVFFFGMVKRNRIIITLAWSVIAALHDDIDVDVITAV